MGQIPVVDIAPWFDGDGPTRERVASEVDAALRSVGFMLVTGHGVPRENAERVRHAARHFFALPADAKRSYAVSAGRRGWVPPGREATGYADRDAEGTPVPPDLKESFVAGADARTGDPDIDDYWFPENVWPGEVPELRTALVDYMARMRALADALLDICAVALGQEDDYFTRHTAASTFTMTINRYPPLADVGEPRSGQFRVGPHTDFGTVTVLDREPGAGGLQVWSEEDGWQDAPHDPEALTVNTGDLLARWSGLRWKSNRHRVLPPQHSHPDEDLLSLVFFYEVDADTRVVPLPPPMGRVAGLDPVVSGEFVKQRIAAITRD